MALPSPGRAAPTGCEAVRGRKCALRPDDARSRGVGRGPFPGAGTEVGPKPGGGRRPRDARGGAANPGRALAALRTGRARRPRRMRSPRPAWPPARDGDPGAQSVSSGGESAPRGRAPRTSLRLRARRRSVRPAPCALRPGPSKPVRVGAAPGRAARARVLRTLLGAAGIGRAGPDCSNWAPGTVARPRGVLSISFLRKVGVTPRRHFSGGLLVLSLKIFKKKNNPSEGRGVGGVGIPHPDFDKMLPGSHSELRDAPECSGVGGLEGSAPLNLPGSSDVVFLGCALGILELPFIELVWLALWCLEACCGPSSMP